MKKERNEQKKHLIWQYLQEEAAQKEFDDKLDNMNRLLQNPEALQRIREYFGYTGYQRSQESRTNIPKKLSGGIRRSLSDKDLALLYKTMEKKVLDFLIYLGKETRINVDMSSITLEKKMVKTSLEEADTTICLPAEFYTVAISLADSSLTMKIRYCPSENCNLIVNVELLTKEGEYEGVIAKNVASQLKRAAPGIPVQLAKI